MNTEITDSAGVAPMQLKEALEVIEQALKDDGLVLGSLSHVWFCNIKLPCFDVLIDYEPDMYSNYSGQMSQEDMLKVSAKMANALMRHLFHITTTYE